MPKRRKRKRRVTSTGKLQWVGFGVKKDKPYGTYDRFRVVKLGSSKKRKGKKGKSGKPFKF